MRWSEDSELPKASLCDKPTPLTRLFAPRLTLFAIRFAHRSLTIVLLALSGTAWITKFITIDLSIYLAVKFLRGDFWHWMSLGGSVEILMSLILRIIVKVINDFTAIVHMSHPYEIGGVP